ncbi:MAG: hypothetical protein AUJ49_11285 [Desulfovibrionaceae bacterium CG1_02_65_16]|nr:MAG: hypothetical protein AUJ49_11285 [Desulfovibrionaceae bacterium CG1_02_65_16]
MPNSSVLRARRAALLSVLLLALAVLLSACWVPERYMGRIKIGRDGSYMLSLDGTALNPEAWQALRSPPPAKEGGKSKPEETAKRRDEILAPMLQELAQLKAKGVVDEAKSIGDGRVRFSLMGAWRIDRSVLVFRELREPLAYTVLPDGTVRVRVKDAVQSRQASALGVKTDGDLSIVVAQGVEVLEHNAQKTPTGPRGSYHWSIGPGTREAPFLRLRFPPESGVGGAAPEPQTPKPQKKLAHH